ncbi:MAG TPA: TetR family transcriptional regulator [Acidimicrobiales bacterium]
MVTPAQLRYQQEPANGSGLRSRKKLRTRHAIQDAALELFVDQGFEATTVEQIAARVEVSPTTFFRYFRSKSEVIKGDQGERLPALQKAIIERPADEDDLEVLRVAIQQEWISSIDPERTLRQASVIAASPELRGVSFEIGFQWRAAISESLAQRHGLDTPDDRCIFAASTAMSVFWRAVEIWRRGGAQDELSDHFDRGFKLMVGLCAEWSASHGTATAI